MSRLSLFALSAMVVLAWVASVGYAADHRDAPGVLDDGRTDINDVYIFQSPVNKENTVLIMTVNPLAGVLNPTTFRSSARYILHVDTDGDAKENFSLTTRFSKPNGSGVQKVALFGAPPSGHGPSVKLAEGLTGQNIKIEDGGKVRAGLFDDPFFFDLDGFKDNLHFTGTNFFAGLNVTAIVIELPSKQLLDSRGHKGGKPDSKIGVWGSTEVDGEQVDRMGRPAINTVLISTELKDDFNAGVPEDDQDDFRKTVVDHLKALGNNKTRANALADVLLPDILTFDTASSSGFLNGRRLKDDVIDIELNLLSNGAIKTDGVDNDSAFRKEFPYLGLPNRTP